MKQDDVHLEDILSDRFAEENYLEIPLAEGVFRAFTVIAVFLVAAAAIQLLRLGVAGGDVYRRRALANMNEVRVSTAPRGIIFDRFEKPLTTNEQSFRAVLVPHALPSSRTAREQAMGDASEILGITGEALRQKIKEHDWEANDRMVLADELNHDQLVAFSSKQVEGIIIEPSFKRTQAQPRVFAQVVGYTGLVNPEDMRDNRVFSASDVIGRTGLEGYYDRYLRGENGKEILVRNARGALVEEKTVSLPRIGDSVYTYIDGELQAYFYERLRSALRALGRDIGVGIALNPKNGEVLALVSVPSFDAQRVAESLSDVREPLFNRAISGLYTPGSTIKPLVAVASLVEGVITPAKEIFSEGFIELPNPYNPERPSRFLDWKPHGWVDMRAALARSSNVYFYEVGGGFKNQRGLGIENLKKWWQEFGLNEKTDIDLMGEKSGFLPDPEWKNKAYGIPWRIGDTYNVSIGQGDLLITPLELLNYISAIANGGTLYQPRIVRQIADENKNILFESAPRALKELNAEAKNALPEIQRGMRDAVVKPYGTASLLSNVPLPLMAKTGSAQVANNTRTNAFFVGYTDDLAILVLIENAREGSLNAVPVAKDVFLWYYENRIKKIGSSD